MKTIQEAPGCNDSFILAKDLELSCDTRKTGLNNNLVLLGTPGSGKTGSVILPNILNSSDRNLIIVDVKGLSYKSCKNPLISNGYKVRNIDLKNPLHSPDRINPLEYIRRKPSNVCGDETAGSDDIREQDILTVASCMIPESEERDRYWVDSSRQALATFLGYVLEKFIPSDRTLAAAAEVFRAFNKELPSAQLKKNRDISFFRDLDEESGGNSYALKMYRNQLPTMLSSDKTWGSISGFISTVFSLTDAHEYAHLLSRSTFSLRDIAREKTALFITISDSDYSAANIISLIFTCLFWVLFDEADANPDGRLTFPVHMFMDDFANYMIPDFQKMIGVFRSRGISASIVLQSLSQLEDVYGVPAAKTILNCADTLMYLGVNDIDTIRYVADRASKLPSTIMDLPSDKAWIFTRGREPVLASKLTPYSYVTHVHKGLHSVEDAVPQVNVKEVSYE